VSWVPEAVRESVANCGGTNRRDRFAGRLLESGLSEREYLRIVHSLIFPNGVRKSTAPGRCAAILRSYIDQGALALRPDMRILDIGASVGVDARTSYDLIAQQVTVARYVLADLYTKLQFDRERGLIFDEDGRLCQVLRPRSFVSINFSWAFPFQRVTNLPKRLRPWLLARRYRFDSKRPLVTIPLVHPALRVDAEDSPFRLRRQDVLQPIGERFDLIICTHLLTRRYFARDEIARGIDNLLHHLEPRGQLLVGVGRKPSYRLLTR
jgi:hypothetical protein